MSAGAYRRLVAGLICMTLLAGCDTEARRKAEAEAARLAEQKRLEEIARSLLADVVFDPTSFLIKDVRRGSDEQGKLVACGKVNAKNRFGGFVGFQPFVARRGEDGQAEVYTDPTGGESSPTPQQLVEAAVYRSKFQQYCAPPPATAKAEPQIKSGPSPLVEPSVPTRNPAPKPVAVRVHKGDTCIGAAVANLTGEGAYLVARAAPQKGAEELFRLHNDDFIYVCDLGGPWHGIVYGSSDDDGDCGVMEAPAETSPYQGSCKTGWVRREWVALMVD